MKQTISTLRALNLVSDDLLDRVLDHLDVPSDATFKVLGANVQKASVVGIGKTGILEIELLKFESGNERLNAGYSPETGTLYLANITLRPYDVTAETDGNGHE